MPTYEYLGNSPFQDNANDRVIEHGDVVELPEEVVGRHSFVEIDEPKEDTADSEDDADLTCAYGDCSRTVDEAGEMCWQHPPEDD